eukprot:TRINITY_DN12721_c0_g1_i1.p1 TRINITY_DN12721_c0_g1~~TRINITY_DN12721_c0_g1_i1.p1  ORF type:complete len:298 (+),score=50.10 TRINITY_DN12721_c0_g1_i1:70-963(+)
MANPYAQPPPPPAAGTTAAVVNPYAHLYVNPADSHEEKLRKLQGVLDKYKITITDKNELMALLEYDIVFVCDDSGSMNMQDRGMNNSRWQELRQTVATLVELACYLDPDGVDVHFLNRPGIFGITSADHPDLLASFSKSPMGSTPLCEAIEQKIIPKYESTQGDKILLVIATDGEPNGGSARFKSLMEDLLYKRRTSKTYKIQIMACTNNESEIAWLNKFDKQFDSVDVTDDFGSERVEVLRGGRVTSFNKADYIVKALLGPVCKRFDNLDERRVGKYEANYSAKKKKSDGCGCIVA